MTSRVWMAMDTVGPLATESVDLADAFLSPPERVRLAALSGKRRQGQFRAGRLLMRRLLARVHGGDALTDWPLTASVDAAPMFMGEAFAQRVGAEWHLSISHSRHYVACAVSASRLGIDIEVPERERDVMALGDVLCSPEELAQLQALQGAQRERYFLALWTLKEAAIKRESGRSSSAALRMLATREITSGDLTGVLPAWFGADPAERARAAPHRPALQADAWTWQSAEATLAVVSDGAGGEPQWALPPPAFILQPPCTWTIQVLPPFIAA